MDYPSSLVKRAVEEFSRLPGIGSKTALRLVLHLLKKNPETSFNLSDSIRELRELLVALWSRSNRHGTDRGSSSVLR